MKEKLLMKKLSLLALGLMFSAGAMAGAADQISVQNPYVRLAPPNAPATGAFMVIKNNGDKDVKVLKADNPVSKVTELHTHLNEGGVMKMRPVPAIAIHSRWITAASTSEMNRRSPRVVGMRRIPSRSASG